MLTGAGALWGASQELQELQEGKESRTKEKYSLSVMLCDREVEEVFLQFIAKECEKVTHLLKVSRKKQDHQ